MKNKNQLVDDELHLKQNR